ncbi:DUF421 domain-containing protein [Ammoniphilus sp. CFH 90114]|uniref:YetF domain-containing protein n=1 Tax=Ammoniphilus sp. CFH 90114 TaxID=2493665 RepID=UPI00100EC34C|nr:DUF421 domain-containing protein [Ammoniphilus sp. CFH 90114]RXT03587.1 DUF421 domain-containing protein [Ammoniphilus sp. CFH 90114]
MSVQELSIRILVSFFILLILTRMMGRKEISQLTFFNFVSGITVGTIAGSLAINKNLSIWSGIFALSGWALLTVIMGFLDIKSKKARIIIEGQPVILIKQGRIMEDELRKVRLDVDALNTLLRKKNVFAITDVEYAIFETDGTLSIMKKEALQPVTKLDMNIMKIKTEIFPISTEVVSDGKINLSNLGKLHLDQDWLKQQLAGAGVRSLSEVFYAEIQKDGTLYIDKRDDSIH